MSRRRMALWISWFGLVWLFVAFLASIVYYGRGVDTVAVLLALLAQVTVTIAWTLWRPLPLWIVYFHALIMLSLVVGFLITVPGAATTLGWMYVGLIPVGVAMILAATLHIERRAALIH